MKLLVLSPVFPDSPADGDRLRLFHWLQELARRHEIHLACFTDPSRSADGIPGGLADSLQSVHKVPWPGWKRRLAAGFRLLGPLPLSVASSQSADMRALVDTLLAQDNAGARPFDAVLAYRLKMAPYALKFKGPRFLDYTDSMTRYNERRVLAQALEGRRLRAAFARFQARKLAAYEAWCAGQFDGGFFNSRQDCEAVRSMDSGAAKALQVAANGVDARHFKAPRAHPDRDPHEILFIGHLAYPPNADAVDWFARQVLPLVRQRVPQAHLCVVGSDAPASLTELAAMPGLRFTGFAADTREHLWRAALSVCPVRSGAGRQNKLLEAFAAGLPAVATSMAAEGAEARAGLHLLVADNASDFADAVVRLLRDPGLGKGLAQRALGLLHGLYEWPANAGVLDRAMSRATQRPLW